MAIIPAQTSRDIVSLNCDDFGDLTCLMDFRAYGEWGADHSGGYWTTEATLCELRLHRNAESYLSLDREQALQMCGSQWVEAQERDAREIYAAQLDEPKEAA